MENLSYDDVDPKLGPKARDTMLDLILSWARYDALVTQWLTLAYGVSLDDGTLLLGNMDTRTKLERIKYIYEHYKMEDAVKSVVALQNTHKRLVWIRNHVAHSRCIGCLRDDPEKVVFLAAKAIKGSVGKMAVHEILVSDMRTAEKFAREVGDELNEFNRKQKARLATQPPEPPQFQ